jgi:hypothetical protein
MAFFLPEIPPSENPVKRKNNAFLKIFVALKLTIIVN